MIGPKPNQALRQTNVARQRGIDPRLGFRQIDLPPGIGDRLGRHGGCRRNGGSLAHSRLGLALGLLGLGHGNASRAPLGIGIGNLPEGRSARGQRRCRQYAGIRPIELGEQSPARIGGDGWNGAKAWTQAETVERECGHSLPGCVHANPSIDYERTMPASATLKHSAQRRQGDGDGRSLEPLSAFTGGWPYMVGIRARSANSASPATIMASEETCASLFSHANLCNHSRRGSSTATISICPASTPRLKPTSAATSPLVGKPTSVSAPAKPKPCTNPNKKLTAQRRDGAFRMARFSNAT